MYVNDQRLLSIGRRLDSVYGVVTGAMHAPLSLLLRVREKAIVHLGCLAAIMCPLAFGAPGDPSQTAIFHSALAADAAGHHLPARRQFDALGKISPLAESAVPSAVNLVLLGRYDEAGEAFAELATGGNARDAEYARLWQLWLVARTSKSSEERNNKLEQLGAGSFSFTQPRYRAIRDLYLAAGAPDQVFDMIGSAPAAEQSELQWGDARAEAAFFVGGYLQYVRQDSAAALKIYRRELHYAEYSLERPLLEKAIRSLQNYPG